jgi:lipopolysaccharide export LptBFGC system permease protein LptF
VRFLVFAIAVVFIIGMAVLTALDFERNGVTGLGIVGLIVVIIVGVGIIGALTEPPRKKK